MIKVFRLAGALEVALVCFESLSPVFQGVLPLCGNHIAQLGAVFGISFAVSEFCEIVAIPFRRYVTRLGQSIRFLRRKRRR
jgi:hypothetical protein